MAPMPVRLLGKEQVAEGTMAFHFEKPPGFRFKAGQAIDLILAESASLSAEAARHAFSIVSAPEERELVIATRMRDSTFKRALGALPIGAQASIDGPFGSLTLHSKVERPAVFIAGGIGITPFMSMLRHAASSASAQKLVLLYSNREPGHAAFLGELEQLARVHPSFHMVATVTGKRGKSPAGWTAETGRINESVVRRATEGLVDPVFYVAGPPAMVASMRDELGDAGIYSDDIRSEEFYGY